MNASEFNTFCATFPHTEFVVQWGGAQVWKVAGKLFAIARIEPFGVTFKAGDIGYEVLREQPGHIPAPYLASRGMKWIQADSTVDDAEIRAHITQSFKLVVGGLSKKKREALGLNDLSHY